MSEQCPEFSVVTWNILSDAYDHKGVDPQNDRWPSLAKAMREVNPAGFDVINLCEVSLHDQEPDAYIAHHLNSPDYAVLCHDNSAEPLLMAVKPSWARPTALQPAPGYSDRVALITSREDIRIAGLHMPVRYTQDRNRSRIIRGTLDAVGIAPKIVMGDLNCLRIQQPRRLLKASGLSSVTERLGKPKTFPTPNFRYRTIKWYQQPVAGRGYSLDDIYYSSHHLELVEATLLHGESDHWGIAATFRSRSRQNLQRSVYA